MNIEEYRDFCLTKTAVTEEFPFDNKTLVFKVAGKMFALCDVDDFQSINLKCDPERAVLLREEYSSIVPGYHMNKTHWNTIQMDGSVPNSLLLELIDHSYFLVANSLTKSVKAQFKL